MDFKTNTLVTGADVKAHTLTTEAGDTITYEKLIVATGSGVRGLKCCRYFQPAYMQGGRLKLADLFKTSGRANLHLCVHLPT